MLRFLETIPCERLKPGGAALEEEEGAVGDRFAERGFQDERIAASLEAVGFHGLGSAAGVSIGVRFVVDDVETVGVLVQEVDYSFQEDAAHHRGGKDLFVELVPGGLLDGGCGDAG